MQGQFDTIVWITGATQGLGAGLARTCPYEAVRIINMSRRPHPVHDTVLFDLGDQGTWPAVQQSFKAELEHFRGKRAIFVHNARLSAFTGFAGELNAADYYRDVIANAAAPMILGDYFLRAVTSAYESGIVMISSTAAVYPIPGRSVYGAAKAGIEQWVRVVTQERIHRGVGPWVIAARPGMVDTPALQDASHIDPTVYPASSALRAAIDRGEAYSADVVAREIWASLPPSGMDPVKLFGTDVTMQREELASRDGQQEDLTGSRTMSSSLACGNQRLPCL